MKIDLYNNQKEIITQGVQNRKVASNEFKLVVQIYIVNQKNELLIQKRVKNINFMPNMWAITSGFVDTNENSITAAIRELKEELGINITKDDLDYFCMIKGRTTYIDAFLLRKDFDLKDITLQKEEVQSVKNVSIEEFKKMIKENVAYCDTFNIFEDYFKHIEATNEN